MSHREPPTADTLADVVAAFDTLRATVPPANARELEPPCRCGWHDDKPWGVKPRPVDPPADLRGPEVDVDLTTNNWHRSIECRSCHHLIYPSTRCVVVHVLHEHAWRMPHYHPECVIL